MSNENDIMASVTAVENTAHENILNVDQQGVKILQTYDSYPDGDVKGLFCNYHFKRDFWL